MAAYIATVTNLNWATTDSSVWTVPGDNTYPGQNAAGDTATVNTSILVRNYSPVYALASLDVYGRLTVNVTAKPSAGTLGVIAGGSIEGASAGTDTLTAGAVTCAGSIASLVAGRAISLTCASLTIPTGGTFGSATQANILTDSGDLAISGTGKMYLYAASSVGGSLTIASTATVSGAQTITLNATSGSPTIAMETGGASLDINSTQAYTLTTDCSATSVVLTAGVLNNDGFGAASGFLQSGGTLNVTGIFSVLGSHIATAGTITMVLGTTLCQIQNGAGVIDLAGATFKITAGAGFGVGIYALTNAAYTGAVPTLGAMPTGYVGSLAVVASALVLTVTLAGPPAGGYPGGLLLRHVGP